MTDQTPREVLRDADWHRRQAEAADLARVKIRLGEQPAMKRGPLWFRKRYANDTELEFTAAETAAIYDALGQVKREHNTDADRLEAMLRVEQS